MLPNLVRGDVASLLKVKNGLLCVLISAVAGFTLLTMTEKTAVNVLLELLVRCVVRVRASRVVREVIAY